MSEKPAPNSASGCLILWAYLMFLSFTLAPVVALLIKGHRS